MGTNSSFIPRAVVFGASFHFCGSGFSQISSRMAFMAVERGAGGVLHQSDGPLGDGQLQRDAEQFPAGDAGGRQLAGVKADAQPVLYHGQDLVHGGGFHVHPEGLAVGVEKGMVKAVGAGALPQADQRAAGQLGQGAPPGGRSL